MKFVDLIKRYSTIDPETQGGGGVQMEAGSEGNQKH